MEAPGPQASPGLACLGGPLPFFLLGLRDVPITGVQSHFTIHLLDGGGRQKRDPSLLTAGGRGGGVAVPRDQPILVLRRVLLRRDLPLLVDPLNVSLFLKLQIAACSGYFLLLFVLIVQSHIVFSLFIAHVLPKG